MIKRFFLSFLFALSLIACGPDVIQIVPEVQMRDGEWFGLGEGRNGMIKVRMDVKDGQIVSIVIVSQSESKFAHPVENELINLIIQSNGVEGVDAVSGATITSNGLIGAVASAIDAAKGISGETIEYKDTSCDIVVVGAGGAGLAAALEATSFGKKVIVLEKQGIIGGNTNSSTGGINAAGTLQQSLLGIADSKELFFNDIMKGGYNLGDPLLVSTLSENAVAAVDWLASLGADLKNVGMMAGSSVPRTHRPESGVAIGPHLMSVLFNEVKKQKIELRTRNKVSGLLGSKERISGVCVETEDGGTYNISAKAVILATGGFGANFKMLVKYRPELDGLSTSNHSGATGDAVEWVEKIGGSLIQMDQIQVHPTGERNTHLLITEAVRGNGAILVNEEGYRFANEMLTRDLLSQAILSQKGRHAYLVFDEAVRSSLSAIDGYEQQGLLQSSMTVAGLSEKIKVPEADLAETFSAYSRYQQSGLDEAFGRKAEEMPLPLTQAPFYAVDVEPIIHHTMGGLRIDSSARVLNQEGEAVSGLFAAGEVTGGVHGGNRLGGNAVADIIVFGRIAGQSAALAR